MATAFLVKWPPGPVVSLLSRTTVAEKEKAVDGAGQRDARETGVEAMGVDVCDCESCEAERGGPLLTLRRRDGRTQSSLSRLRLGRPQMREVSTALPLPLERGM